MKIAIDIDEVILSCIEKYLEFVGNKGYKRVCYEDVFSYRLWEVLEIEKEVVSGLFNEYNSSEYFKRIDFVEGAKDGVINLRDNHNIYFITARPINIIKETRDVIFSEFGVLRNRVVFAGDLIVNHCKRKDEICEEMGIDLIIEDNGEDSLKYAKNGLRVLLLDKPWNQGIEHKNVFRCFSWGEILERVEELEGLDL